MTDLPELPQVPDAAAALVAWLLPEAVKRIAAGRTWEPYARRALPLVAVAGGAAARVIAAAVLDGIPLGTAALRGAIAGGVAVYAQQIRTATIAGEVGRPGPERWPLPGPTAEDRRILRELGMDLDAPEFRQFVARAGYVRRCFACGQAFRDPGPGMAATCPACSIPCPECSAAVGERCRGDATHAARLGGAP